MQGSALGGHSGEKHKGGCIPSEVFVLGGVQGNWGGGGGLVANSCPPLLWHHGL